MIVNDLDLMRIARIPDEADPPLIVDPDAVLPSSISLQFLQPIPERNPKILERNGGIEQS